MKSKKKIEVVNWDEEIGGVKNSPRYDPEEAAAVAANVKEAESMFKVCTSMRTSLS